MAVKKTKHQFVDDNPYLVYSGEPESTVDNAGGGGGDDSPFLYITVNEDMTTWTTTGVPLTISENKETIVNAMRAGKMVIFIATQDYGDNFYDQNYIPANAIAYDDSYVVAPYIIATNTGTKYFQIFIDDNRIIGKEIRGTN